VDFNRLATAGIPEIEIACERGTTFKCVFPEDKNARFQSISIIGYGGVRGDDLMQMADICDRLTIRSARVMPSTKKELYKPRNRSLTLSLCDVESDEGNREAFTELISCAKDLRLEYASIPRQAYSGVESVLYVGKPRGDDLLDWMGEVFPNAGKFTLYCGFVWGMRTDIAKKSIPLDIAVPNGAKVYIRHADEYKFTLRGGELVHEAIGETLGAANMSPAVEVKVIERKE